MDTSLTPRGDSERILDRVAFDIEAGKVREFARATFVQDPVHTDPSVAVERGFGACPATPTHVVAAGHHRDQQQFVRDLDMAIERVVVGSVEWDYRRPLVVGDHVTGVRQVVEDTTRTGRRGGTMRLVTLETEWVDADGLVTVVQRETLIERGA